MARAGEGRRPDRRGASRNRSADESTQHHIRIENARTHNLKGVSCSIPLRALTVITGVSGSGKSTLAFDTLYAEGQRRYVTSLSTYARQFLERMPRPDVDAIGHLPPAIAIEQRNRVTGARSTVGTATEILDHLRLLFARAGVSHCPDCKERVEPGIPEAIAARLLSEAPGERLTVGAPLPPKRKESGKALYERLMRDGLTRLLDAEGERFDLEDITSRELARRREGALLLIDRLRLEGEEGRSRLVEAIANAFRWGNGEALAVSPEGERRIFREGFRCDSCGRALPAPEPALFSFNSPLGACDECQGFGRVAALDLERVVPDPSGSIAEGAIAPFQTPMGRSMQRDLMDACADYDIPTDRPWESLRARDRALVLDGDDEDWYGVRGFFDWLERRRYRVQARVLIARYRRFDPCPACGETRLCPEALAVRVGDTDIGTLSRATIDAIDAWLAALRLEGEAAARAERLVEVLRARVSTALEVGLGYLSLDRQMRTLSGGEAQRIQLSRALGGTLTDTLYVLDEPSVGLHARDVDRLLRVLRAIRDHGNTVVVVEHAPEIIAAADCIFDLGPGPGRDGGEVVAEGDLATLRAHPTSLTGRVLRGEFGQRPRARAAGSGRREALRIVGASAHNLKDVDVELPLRRLVCVTGVSGAGKSSLIRSVLVGHLTRDPERGACEALEGAEQIDEVVLVDPSPPARNARSNPATLSKAFDGIRKKFAATREARAEGLSPGWFSFNVAGGRCEHCEGAGEVVVDMQFLEDLRVPCEHCDGTRYKAEARRFQLRERNIVDVLAMTLDEAAVFFAEDRQVVEKLRPYIRVGLGYLRLGQPLSTLSGGESQRLRIAGALGGTAARSLFVFDEPTTGLHPADVEVLLACLDELIDAGASVIVVEHNLDVIRRADWVIDLGPEGGPGGGHIVAQGGPHRSPASRAHTPAPRSAASTTSSRDESAPLTRGREAVSCRWRPALWRLREGRFDVRSELDERGGVRDEALEVGIIAGKRDGEAVPGAALNDALHFEGCERGQPDLELGLGPDLWLRGGFLEARSAGREVRETGASIEDPRAK